ncbi:MAG: hypothetical protein Q8K82_12570 [Gemmatimonadaceae bacterium]|nr:hypothetical protein [Gemmatimonadaceae bacterium]
MLRALEEESCSANELVARVGRRRELVLTELQRLQSGGYVGLRGKLFTITDSGRHYLRPTVLIAADGNGVDTRPEPVGTGREPSTLEDTLPPEPVGNHSGTSAGLSPLQLVPDGRPISHFREPLGNRAETARTVVPAGSDEDAELAAFDLDDGDDDDHAEREAECAQYEADERAGMAEGL